MAPTNAKLKVVETQISDTMSHIQELKSQVEQAEIKLQRLQEEKASILETFADHRRVFSPFRNLPEDVLREICITCVNIDIPTLSYGSNPLPYILAQICSGMRYIALETPYIWASMKVSAFPYCYPLDQCAYSVLASKASEWLERASGQPLTIFMEEIDRFEHGCPGGFLSGILFDTLLSYSSRWKSITYGKITRNTGPSTPIARIAALTASDVPLLESISLHFQFSASVLRDNPILSIPTLRCLTLGANWYDSANSAVISEFTVNWSNLTSVTIRGGMHDHVNSIDEIVEMLRKTKRLLFCDITYGKGSGTPLSSIDLPFLEVLCINNTTIRQSSSDTPSLFNLINAPILATLEICTKFVDISLERFFEQSPGLRELSLSLSHSKSEQSLAVIVELLRHCPSLSVLTVQPLKWRKMRKHYDANIFLRAFVEDGGLGATCPCLQNFNFAGAINFSVQTLRQFLEAKQHGIAPPNGLVAWKRVRITMYHWWGTYDSELAEKLDVVLQQQLAGLDVYLYPKDDEYYN